VLYGAEQVAKGSGFPDENTWSAGHLGAVVFVFTSVTVLAGYFLVTRGYAHELKQSSQSAPLQAVCRNLADMMQRHTGIPRDQLGAHVWTVSGPPTARYLRRRATFLVADRDPTMIAWREGKGAIGVCWSRATAGMLKPFVADVEALESLGPDQGSFCALAPVERFNLNWREFQMARQYRAIWVCPLFARSADTVRFVGCISVDVQADGQAQLLEQAIAENEDAIARFKDVCESVLT
jgi:hypothetical protein